MNPEEAPENDDDDDDESRKEDGFGTRTQREEWMEMSVRPMLSGKAIDVLRGYESALADSEYFRDKRNDGTLKKCPKCGRLIEKLEGCDAMVCGNDAHGGNAQNGCGHSFSWGAVPFLPLSDVPSPELGSMQLNLKG